jgi:hypothetical protein
MHRPSIAFLLVALLAAPAGAASSKACRQACGAMIQACVATNSAFGFGNVRRGCKQAVLKQCKRAGVGACVAFCGDGVAGPEEACDGADLRGATCAGLGFASGTLACSRDCRLDTAGCANFPPLQPPLCGNGRVDAPESCDGGDLGGATCAGLGFASGTLACTAGCGYDTSGCMPYPAPTCGNGAAEGAEQCDGADLAAATCQSLGFASGVLACTAGCGYDTSGCVPYPAPTCGNGAAEGVEQCDGGDLRGATCASLGFTRGGTLGCTAGCGFDTSGCASQAFPASGRQPMPVPVDKNDGIVGAVDVLDDGWLRAGLLPAYVDNGDGTITDPATGLMWEKKSFDNGPHDYRRNLRYAGDGTQETVWDWLDDVNTEGGTGFAGHRDWRIPNPKELQSIIDYGTSVPAVADAFNKSCALGCTVLTCSCTQPDGYWSSSTLHVTPLDAWAVSFFGGGVGPITKTALAYFRAVRGGSVAHANLPCVTDNDCPNQRCRAGQCGRRRPCSDVDPQIGRTACFDREACVNGLCECGGDCNLDGIVFGSEISAAISIINGSPLNACFAADINGDGFVFGNEIPAAVVNLANGCVQDFQP